MGGQEAETCVECVVEAGSFQSIAERAELALVEVAERAMGLLCWEFPELGGRELSILLCDDERIRALNREFRHKDQATDVLSFPSGAGPVLGDLAISVECAAARIDERSWPLGDELAFLLIHGLLHLLGHDHEVEADRVRMEAEEQRLWDLLGKTGRLREER